MKSTNIVAILALFAFVITSCDKKEDDVVAAAEKYLETGSYTISCFLNRPATEGMGSPVYTIATMNLQAGGTGTNDFALYTDSACATAPAMSGTNAIASSETILVDGVKVFKYEQDDGVNPPMTIWMPYAFVGNQLYFDVDYTDGESGPYLVEPTPEQVLEFKNHPATEGILAVF